MRRHCAQPDGQRRHNAEGGTRAKHRQRLQQAAAHHRGGLNASQINTGGCGRDKAAETHLQNAKVVQGHHMDSAGQAHYAHVVLQRNLHMTIVTGLTAQPATATSTAPAAQGRGT